jgi:1-phosphofructokinase family hexose kinase
VILCVSPNPAIDRTYYVSNFVAGKVYRPQKRRAAAGGKGINVARAVKALGGESKCAGFLGGRAGQDILKQLEQEALNNAWTQIDGETRTCILIADPTTGAATVLNEPGPAVSPDDWDHLRADLLREARKASHVCFSGSLPPGPPVSTFTGLLRTLCEAGHQVWVDTSGEALHAAIQARVSGIKVNGDEAGTVLGKAVISVENAVEAAHVISSITGGQVVLTLGGDGAVLVNQTGAWSAQPPAIQVINNVGSGDSVFAGLMLALAQGLPHEEALRRGVAAGTANAAAEGGGFFTKEDYEQILAKILLRKL